jgi:hypothetical protein
MYFRRSASVLIVILFFALAIPARAAGFGDYVVSPLRTFVLTIENVFTQLVGMIEPHHTPTVQIAPRPWHATSTTQTAAVFNAAVASLQTPAATAASPLPHQPLAVTQASTPSPAQYPITPAPTAVLAASLPAANYVTQDELVAQLQLTTKNLRSLIYSNTNGGATSQVAQGQYASGGITNNIALASKIDQLNGTTLNNVTVNGIGGITASSLPAIDLTSKVTGILPIGSGGFGTSTAPGANKLPLSDANGNWEYVATSSLGITGGGVTLTGTQGQVAYFSDTNTAAGTSTIFIASNGNVGIGTSSPTGALVVQPASDSQQAIQFANHAGAPLITIDTTSDLPSGAIGIGTTTPATALDIFHGQITVESQTASQGMNLIVHNGSNPVFRAPQILFEKSRGTQAAPTPVQNGDILGYLQWLGFDGTNESEGSVIESTAAENFVSGTNWGTNLDFYTAPIGRVNQTIRMRLGANGNVGIGNINPTYVLDVSGNGHFSSLVDARNFVATSTSIASTFAYYVGIGTSSPDMLLSVGSATPTGSVAHFENSTGSCYINPTTTSLSCSSDAAEKKHSGYRCVVDACQRARAQPRFL